MKLLYSLLLLSISIQLQASREGNGGDAIVCQLADNKGQRVELLDYYQAFDRGYIKELDLAPAKGDFDSKVRGALKRLASYDSVRASRYLDWYEDFFSKDNFSWEEKLGPVDDSGSSSYEKNCLQVQAAIQEKPLFPQDKRYKIAKPIWDKMDADHKAGLILHELIYRDVLEIKEHFLSIKDKPAIFLHPDSRKLRYFNAIISSKEFSNYTEKDYHELVIQTDLLYVTKDSYSFSIQDIDWQKKELYPVKREYYEDTGMLASTSYVAKTTHLDFQRGQIYESLEGYQILTGHQHSLKFNREGKINSSLNFGYRPEYELILSPVISLKPMSYDWNVSQIRIENGKIAKEQNYYKGQVLINTEKLKAKVNVDLDNGYFSFSFGEDFMLPSFGSLDAIHSYMFPIFEYDGKKYNLLTTKTKSSGYPYIVKLHFDPSNSEPLACMAYQKDTGRYSFRFVRYCGYLKDILRFETSDFDNSKIFRSNNAKRDKLRCERYLKDASFDSLLVCSKRRNCNRKREYCGYSIYPNGGL
tara:strand:- start:10960 stop:12543 length:1584 start_codon:yes stop_codon:yes gene_type:complete